MMSCPATELRSVRLMSPKVSAVHVVATGRDVVPASLSRAARDLPASRSCSSRSDLERPRTSPSVVTAVKVIRRWSGSAASRKSDAATSTPVRARISAATASVRGLLLGVTDSSICAARSGAGPTCRRRDFGSVRISSVISSKRIPGTSQSNPEGRARTSSDNGIRTLTPSSTVPGSNRYLKA